MNSASIISTGRELIRGRSSDTNWQWLSQQLNDRGIGVRTRLVVDDHLESLVSAIQCATESADVVIMTGGLGPTHDDLTREAVAKAAGTGLEMDTDALKHIETFFERRGREMSKTNQIQAMLPVGATAITNDIGTAPGIDITIGRCRLFALPGVPVEMRAMFDGYVSSCLPDDKVCENSKTIQIAGIGESSIADRLADVLEGRDSLTTGITANDTIVTVRLSSTDPQLVDEMTEEVRQRLGKCVIGTEGESLEAVIGDLLLRRGETMSTAESCTGGLVGSMLTSIPGSSEYFLGGVVAYSNDIKANILGVPEEVIAEHGAVSELVAISMAEGARAVTGSDWSIAITGTTGPGGGTEEKPVGLVFTAVSGRDGTKVSRHFFSGDRATIQKRSAATALNSLRLEIN